MRIPSVLRFVDALQLKNVVSMGFLLLMFLKSYHLAPFLFNRGKDLIGIRTSY
jgi:hypothetical protein